MERSLFVILVCLCAGCGFPEPVPGEVVIPDDDDIAGSDDDDATSDDDDASGDDDDDGAPTALRAWATLNTIDALGAGGVQTGVDHEAIGSFGAGAALAFGDPGGLDGMPLIGAMLHPERAADSETCEELFSSDPFDPLPLTQSVGGIVALVPASAGSSLELPETGGVYSLQDAGELGANLWSIAVKGGGDWPPAVLDDVLELPPVVTSPLPGPGNIGSLATVQMRWDALADPGGVEIVLFRWTTANQTQWAEVRCRSTDDGEMFVPASVLAAGNGDILVTLSRATWVTSPIAHDGTTISPHIGAVRSVRYRLTPG